MRTLALVAVLLSPVVAHAEGDNTFSGPMLGGAVLATHDTSDAAGAGLELALWRDWIGVAAEAAYQKGLVVGGESQVASVGASARVLLFHQLMPSLIDPRETVEAGIELQGILERVWRDGDAATAYGLGLALRLRGGTDFSNLLAESRLFVRVLATPRSGTPTALARTTMPETTRELAILVGLGAMFGGGEPGYVRRFRPLPLAVD